MNKPIYVFFSRNITVGFDLKGNTMIHCSNCNFELPESAKFCPECGTPYTPEVKSTVDTPEAALREKNVCDKCGLELPIGAKFCTICGGKAIKDTSVITPTSCIIGGTAASATVSGGMMESVAVEAVEETPAAPAPAPEAAPFGETVAPFVADISAPVETPATAPFAAPVVDIPEIAEMGEIPEIAEIPEMGAIPEMPAENTAPVTPTPAVAPVPTVNTIQQPASPASPLSQPIAPTQPVSAISQPVSATQPVSASPIIPPVSGTATAVMPNPAPVNPANSLNPNMQTGTMPTYNAAPAGTPGFAPTGAVAPAVNLGKGGSAVNYANPVNNANPAASSNNAKSGKKKMPIGGKIGIIAGSLVAACAVAAGVFFALDKATFLSTLLGKEKYAVMVESKAITDVANQIDTQSISDGVEAVSSVYSAMAQLGVSDDDFGPMIDIEDMSNTAASQSAVPMMSVVPMNSTGEIDMAAYIKAVNELYLKTYGVNSVKEQMSIDVEVGDALIDLAGGDSATIKEIEKLINNTEIACDAIVDENAMQVTYDIKLDQATVDCKVIVNSDNEMYIAFPFVSDKAFLMKLPVPSEEVKEPAVLQLDKAELTRIIGEVVQSYLMNYKSAAIEMEEGSVKVAGVTVSGKEITAEFEGELLEKLFTDIAEIIAKDEYLKNKIVEYCNEIGVEMTAEKYETAIMDAIEFEAGDGDKLVITTIIDKKGNILAKKIEAVDVTAGDDPEKVTVGWTMQEKVAAFEMTFGDEGKVTVKADIMNESDFDMTVGVESDGEQMVFNVNCMGVKTEQYCGQEVAVGTYVISMELPESFEDQLGSKEAFAAINNMTLTFSTKIEGNTQNAYVRLDASKYGSVQMNVSAAAENDSVSEYPTDVIDLTPVLEQGTLDNTAMGRLKDYLDEVGVAYDGIRNALSGYSIFEELPEFTNPLDSSTGPAHGDDALSPDEILQYIEEDLQELAEYTLLVDSSNTEMLSRIIGLVKKYSDLSENVKQLAEASAETEGYAEALAAAEEQYWELFDELWDIEIEIDESGSGQSLSDMLPSVNAGEFTKMDYTDIYGIMIAYNTVFDTIKYNEKELIIDDKLRKLYDVADYARIDVDHDWDYFYESLNRGNLNINLLNNFRNSMKDYVPAVNALVDELEARGLA